MKNLLSIKLEKDSEITGYIHIRADEIVIERNGRERVIRALVDKASPSIAKTKEGEPLFMGDIIVQEHFGWQIASFKQGVAKTKHKLVPTGFEFFGYDLSP